MYRFMHYSLWRSPLTNLKCKPYYSYFLHILKIWVVVNLWFNTTWLVSLHDISINCRQRHRRIFLMHCTTMVISMFIFVHWFSIFVNIFSTNNGIFHQMLGVSSMLGIWCVGCLWINMEEFANICNAISLKFERGDKVGCILVCIWLKSLILIFLFHVCFLRWVFGDHKCADCMSLICEKIRSILPKGWCGAKL